MKRFGILSGALAGCLGLGACTVTGADLVPGTLDPVVTVREVAETAGAAITGGGGSGTDPSGSGAGAGSAAQAGSPEVVPGQVLVTLAAKAAVPTDFGAAGQAKILGHLEFSDPVALLRLPPGISIEDGIRKLASRPGVLGVSPNRRVKPLAAENPPTDDPYLPMQWPYGSDRADVYGAWSVLDTVSPEAVAGTTIAVVDTGTDPDHEDLNVLPGYDTTMEPDTSKFPAEVATSFFDPAYDDHGTAVAGVIGAYKANGIGAAGVAPGVSILPVRVFSDTNLSGSDYAILYALKVAAFYNRSDSPFGNTSDPAAGPVRVVNMSLGGFGSRSAAYESAFEFLRQRGIVVIVAAGNGGGDGYVESPANNRGAIAVSVTMDYLGKEILTPYSSIGEELWVAGPGNYIWSTGKLNTYHLFNGTSSAAPFVAGVAALINAVYGPGESSQDTAEWADRVRARLKESADDLGNPGWDSLYGWGRVNAKKAVTGDLP